MSKTNLKVDLSAPKKVDLFFMGISSSAGVAVLANQINRYLDINLSFYLELFVVQKDVISDKLPIFTTFDLKKNELNLNSKLDEEIDLLDMRLMMEDEATKFLLMRIKGEKSNLFPKINPMDFIFISNYPLTKYSDHIKSIPEVTIQYELKMEHVIKQYKYFSELFYN